MQKLTSRQAQKDRTRARLLETALKIIGEEGLGAVTLPKVAERTGLSRGICNYHFQTKDQLLLESFLSLYHEHQQTWRGIVRSGSLAPAKRLTMLVHALLTPPLAEHGKLAVWTAFWGSPHYRRIYIDLCTEGDSLYEKGVASLLKELADGRNTVKGLSLHAIAVSLTALIDGCHLQYLIAPGRLTPEDAEDACRSYLCHFFPDAFAKNDYRKP